MSKMRSFLSRLPACRRTTTRWQSVRTKQTTRTIATCWLNVTFIHFYVPIHWVIFRGLRVIVDIELCFAMPHLGVQISFTLRRCSNIFHTLIKCYSLIRDFRKVVGHFIAKRKTREIFHLNGNKTGNSLFQHCYFSHPLLYYFILSLYRCITARQLFCPFIRFSNLSENLPCK